MVILGCLFQRRALPECIENSYTGHDHLRTRTVFALLLLLLYNRDLRHAVSSH